MRLIALCLIVFSFLNNGKSFSSAIETDYGDLIYSFKKSGFRDLSVIESGDTLKINYRPIGFRDKYDAIDLIYLITEKWLKEIGKDNTKYLKFTQREWGIKLINCVISRDTKSKEYYRDYSEIKSERQFSSLSPSLPYLLQFDIPLKASFGDYYDPLVFKTGIRPDFRFMVRRGLVLYSQLDIYIHNEYDSKIWYSPANIGFVYVRPIDHKLLSVLNIGAFQKDLYGLDEEIRFSTLKDCLTLSFHGGFYGDLTFKNNKYKYTELYRHIEIFKALWSYAPYDCSVGIKGGRFLGGDKGYGVEVSRIFKELEIGVSGIISDSEFITNIEFSIPLPTKKRKVIALFKTPGYIGCYGTKYIRIN